MKTYNAYIDAIIEAERFLKQAKLALKVMQDNDYIYSSKELASAKRASMDLTRILVFIRKPFEK